MDAFGWMLSATERGCSDLMGAPQTPNTSSLRKRVQELWFIRTMEYSSAVKRKEILIFAATWMNPENMALSDNPVVKGQNDLIPLNARSLADSGSHGPYECREPRAGKGGSSRAQFRSAMPGKVGAREQVFYHKLLPLGPSAHPRGPFKWDQK